METNIHYPTESSLLLDMFGPNTLQSEADEEFLAAQQNHPGIESEINALHSGNALKSCRDRSEVGYERYLQMAILGRNLHTLGRMLIARVEKDSTAGRTRRKAASPSSQLHLSRCCELARLKVSADKGKIGRLEPIAQPTRSHRPTITPSFAN